MPDRDAKASGWAGADSEGSLFVLERDQIDPLLEEGLATVRGLYDGRVESIRLDQLHRTSLYRLWRLRLAMRMSLAKEG